mmetsp:Transcript_64491/g.203889  ORF Transcript_64491/g.203889 Transcript_64491/m.203889 type:complete len:324 (+) Transcript_64491:1364-2335(+)
MLFSAPLMSFALAKWDRPGLIFSVCLSRTLTSTLGTCAPGCGGSMLKTCTLVPLLPASKTRTCCVPGGCGGWPAAGAPAIAPRRAPEPPPTGPRGAGETPPPSQKSSIWEANSEANSCAAHARFISSARQLSSNTRVSVLRSAMAWLAGLTHWPLRLSSFRKPPASRRSAPRSASSTSSATSACRQRWSSGRVTGLCLTCSSATRTPCARRRSISPLISTALYVSFGMCTKRVGTLRPFSAPCRPMIMGTMHCRPGRPPSPMGPARVPMKAPPLDAPVAKTGSDSARPSSCRTCSIAASTRGPSSSRSQQLCRPLPPDTATTT